LLLTLSQKKLAGLESQGMILAANDEDGGPVLYNFDKKIPSGSLVK